MIPTTIGNDRIVAGKCRTGLGSYGGESLSFSFFLRYSWLAYLKGSKFTLIFSKFRFRFECRACVSVSGHCLFLYFQIITELSS